MHPPKATIFIASPASRSANNGNWQTACRWSRFLRGTYRVLSDVEWHAGDVLAEEPVCLIALHARRSASSIARFAEAFPASPLIVVLTGTDLYRDIRADASARCSLDLATHLVTLQDKGPAELDSGHRAKCRVIYQSAPLRKAVNMAREGRTFDVAFVGHMRAEKDPLTPMRALERLPDDTRVRMIHIGNALESEYEVAARALHERSWPGVKRYVWLAGLPHAETRRHIGRARALVISSVIEGGANVIIEAINAGVPVIASHISGHVGMLGEDYNGYFNQGDHVALSLLLDRVSRDPAFLALLRDQCALRAPLFVPERERAHIIGLLGDALGKLN